MLKKLILTIVGLCVLVGILAAVKFAPGFGQFSVMAASGANMAFPPEVVTSAPVKAEEWETTLRSTGSLVTVQGVTVSAELAGKVVHIAFEPGAVVAAGDLLVQLDTSTEEAQLRAAEASAALAKVNLERSTDLLTSNTISKSDHDLVDAQYKQATAQADSIRAVIAKKSIKAPFAGRLGIRLINLGQILKEGDAIVSLQTLDPIFLNFSLPQQQLANITLGSLVRITTDAASSGSYEGKISAINPDVDPATRSVRIQATLPNPAEKLHPGMFANAEIVLPAHQNVLVIPATAVLYAPYGDSVFVIDEKKNEHTGQMEKILRQQFIRLGEARGDFVTVVSGLKANEAIVTSGVFKLRAGMAVMIDNKLAPDAQLSPKPENT
ncbi:MAG TPA: efflux RND transporter periplasmic adaptor subunit [Lacunisphaera sp.]|nr:efflux RND transporter periplasmic adaptor subunit [Lacunisphaera sp.]